MEETDLIISSDNALRLTTQRIIYQKDSAYNEILLKDYVASSIVYENIGNYNKKLLWSSSILIVLVAPLALAIGGLEFFKDLFRLIDIPLFLLYCLLAFFTLVVVISSLVHFVLGRRAYLKIEGRVSTIIVSLYPWKNNARHLMARMESESKRLTPLKQV